MKIKTIHCARLIDSWLVISWWIVDVLLFGGCPFLLWQAFPCIKEGGMLEECQCYCCFTYIFQNIGWTQLRTARSEIRTPNLIIDRPN